MDVSGIEALPSTRLYEMRFEQKWGTKLALRAGQLAADTEFMTAKYTDVFTNASLRWPVGLSLNMPSGGPSPPLVAVGARLRADVSDNLSLLGAQSLTAMPPVPGRKTHSSAIGTVRVNDPPLLLGDMQLLWNAKKGDPGLDGKLKFGAWRHFGDFSDQRLTASGVTLAIRYQAARPPCCGGNFGFYTVFEQ
jgi:porin